MGSDKMFVFMGWLVGLSVVFGVLLFIFKT